MEKAAEERKEADDSDEECRQLIGEMRLLVNELIKYMKFFVDEEDFYDHFECLKNWEFAEQLRKNYYKFMNFLDIQEILLFYSSSRDINNYKRRIKKLNEGYDYWRFYKGLKENPAGGEPLSTSNIPRPSDYRFGVD